MSNGTVVAFLGSPRKNGRTAALLASALAGAKSAGMVAKEYHLNDPGVRGCQGCNKCRDEYGCALQDALSPMYADIAAASAVVFATPNYYYQISGQAKLWLDRTLPMLGGNACGFHPRQPGKNVLALYTQGNPDVAISGPMIEGMNKVFAMYGWTVAASLVASGADMEGTPTFDALLRQAREAGATLANR